MSLFCTLLVAAAATASELGARSGQDPGGDAWRMMRAKDLEANRTAPPVPEPAHMKTKAGAKRAKCDPKYNTADCDSGGSIPGESIYSQAYDQNGNRYETSTHTHEVNVPDSKDPGAHVPAPSPSQQNKWSDNYHPKGYVEPWNSDIMKAKKAKAAKKAAAKKAKRARKAAAKKAKQEKIRKMKAAAKAQEAAAAAKAELEAEQAAAAAAAAAAKAAEDSEPEWLKANMDAAASHTVAAPPKKVSAATLQVQRMQGPPPDMDVSEDENDTQADPMDANPGLVDEAILYGERAPNQPPAGAEDNDGSDMGDMVLLETKAEPSSNKDASAEVAALAQAKSKQSNSAKMAKNAAWLESHIPGIKYQADAEKSASPSANSNSEWADALKDLMNHPSSNSLREQLHNMH